MTENISCQMKTVSINDTDSVHSVCSQRHFSQQPNNFAYPLENCQPHSGISPVGNDYISATIAIVTKKTVHVHPGFHNLDLDRIDMVSLNLSILHL